MTLFFFLVKKFYLFILHCHNNHKFSFYVIFPLQQSFKFDPSKNFLASATTNPETSTPILNFKPQQLFNTSTPNQQVQIASQIETSPKFFIRAQAPQTAIVKSTTTTIPVVKQDLPPKQMIPIQPMATIRSTKTAVAVPKPTLVLQSTSTAQSSFDISSTTGVPKLTLKSTPKMYIQSKPIPIRPKEPQPVIQQQVITISSNVPPFSRINQLTYGPPVPALALIQPKPIKAIENEQQQICEVKEKTPEVDDNNDDNMLDIRRIIEGDPNEIDQQVAIIQSQSWSQSQSSVEYEHEHEPESVEHEHQESSSQSLLCEEIIDSVTPESDKNSGGNSSITPVKSDECFTVVEDVKKNLVNVLVSDCDKENITFVEEAELSDESKATDFEESLKKSEITKSSKSEMMVELSAKTKRVRKPKNPTVNASLGLPFKPNSISNRRSKFEMKLELELDFHDPINKICWDDGVGGIDNCNKLFGFDEFGLIEVLSKKDLLAKFKTHSDVKEEEIDGNFKLKKLSDPKDHFVCSVCAKRGTVREFFSPETCSESCMAIMKRKTQCEVNELYT